MDLACLRHWSSSNTGRDPAFPGCKDGTRSSACAVLVVAEGRLPAFISVLAALRSHLSDLRFRLLCVLGVLCGRMSIVVSFPWEDGGRSPPYRCRRHSVSPPVTRAYGRPSVVNKKCHGHRNFRLTANRDACRIGTQLWNGE